MVIVARRWLRYLRVVHAVVLVVIVVGQLLFCLDMVSTDVLACGVFGPIMV